jgi:hypothetical protein
VRGLQVQRLELLWSVVEDHVREVRAGDRMLDPRMLEIGARVLKDEAAIYRLGKAAPVAEDEEDMFVGVDRRALVLESLKDVEARLREQSA